MKLEHKVVDGKLGGGRGGWVVDGWKGRESVAERKRVEKFVIGNKVKGGEGWEEMDEGNKKGWS